MEAPYGSKRVPQIPTNVLSRDVGLISKTPETTNFLGKGWKLATTHEGLARSMELPCMCTQKHAPCQGSLTRMSAYYTDDFAKRVCRTILQSQNQTEVYQELVGKREPPKGFVGYPKECTCESVRHPKSAVP